MFISKSTHGYYRGTEQYSGRGRYVALFAWNDYKALDELIAACAECQAKQTAYDAAIAGVHDVEQPPPEAIATYRQACTIGRTRCAAHAGIHSGLPIPRYDNGKPKLWAIVRSCALHQCGHFMMGTIRIGGTSIGVSGSCGADGLPLDYQKVPPAYRHLLIEVPEAVATAYWADNGHNDIGASRAVVGAWVDATFMG